MAKSQLGLSTGVQNVSSSAYDRYRGDRGRGDDRGRPSPSASSADTARVAGDERTNSLLVTATVAQHKIIEELLKATDVPAEQGGRGPRRNNQPYLKVYTLHASDPQEVTKTLDALMPGVVVNEDGRNRKIHINAPQAVHEEVEQLLRQLDGPGDSGTSAVTVIPLSALDPYSAAATVRSLFSGDGSDAPVVEADTYGRRLLVRGTPEQVAQVRTLLTQLGEDGTGRGGPRNSSGTVRTIPLGGRDPEELLPLLQRLWDTSGDAPLRVVPSRPGTIIERRRLGQPEEEPSARDTDASTSVRPAANFDIKDAVPVAAEGAADERQAPAEAAAPATPSAADENAPAVASQPAEPAPTDATTSPDGPMQDRQPAAPPRVRRETARHSPVAVTIQNGSLVITSDDEESLDRLEDLIQRLGQVVPPRTKWSVFYLRTADATETAMLLEQLFPSSSVGTSSLDGGGMFGSLTSGISSFGGKLMNAAGLDSLGLDSQTLRIIPDIRSNSLFVTGPPDKVAEIEQVLNVLDGDNQENLRERLPRMIEVKHADVEEVADIIREVYKDYLQPANAAGGANPLAMLLGNQGGGGRNRGNDDKDPGKIRLTVGVDTRTSQLVVSASDALFRQIEGLVQELDESARAAHRTVRVVTLENVDAAQVQNTLGALIPQVRTSTTGDRRSRTSSQPGSSQSNAQPSGQPQGGPSQEDQDRIRRFMEMRQRMQQGGGGGSPFGGRGGFGGFGGGDRGGDRGRRGR
jgi:type II secretory pathway component GspD/PulD (secretin)